MAKEPKKQKPEVRVVNALLIEDDADDALMFEEALKKIEGEFDVRLQWVESLEDGVERLTTSTIDVVFLDLSLPGTQGIDTFLSLHDQYTTLPIVILTGFTHDSFAEEARKQGAREYLVKDEIDAETLSRVFRDIVD